MPLDALVAEWDFVGTPDLEGGCSMRFAGDLPTVEVRLDHDDPPPTPPGLPSNAVIGWFGGVQLVGGGQMAQQGVWHPFTPDPDDGGSGYYNGFVSGGGFSDNLWIPGDDRIYWLLTRMIYWRCRLVLHRNTWPAAVGQFRVELLIDSPYPPTAPESSTSLSIDVPGLWGHNKSIVWSYHFPGELGFPGSPPTGELGVTPVALSYPGGAEAIDTSVLVERKLSSSPRTLTATVRTADGSSPLGFRPPWSRGLSVEPLNGGQMIAQRAVAAGSWGTMYQRGGPDAPWTPLVGVGGADWGRGVVMLGDRLYRRAQPLAPLGSPSASQTADLGASWALDLRELPATVALPLTDAFLDPQDGLRAGVGLDFAGGSERVFFWSVDAKGQYVTGTVAAALRGGNDWGCLPFPHLYRRADGRWACGWFTPWAYHEYVSETVAGDVWSLNPLTPGLAGWYPDDPDFDQPDTYLGAACFTAFWQGRDGQQAVAGYHFATGGIYVMHRPGVDGVWRDRGPLASPTMAVAPYLYQRDDGQWELGYLEAGNWVMLRAPWPGGTWSLV